MASLIEIILTIVFGVVLIISMYNDFCDLKDILLPIIFGILLIINFIFLNQIEHSDNPENALRIIRFLFLIFCIYILG
jgi:NhaP-type Na+/H+ or K+/H+ antiporter